MRLGKPQDSEHVKALSDEQLVGLLDRLPEERTLFFEFLVEMGLRIGEAIEVRWRDFDGLHVEVGQRWLRVERRYYRGRVARPKGRKTRRIPLTAEIAAALRAHRDATGGEPDGLVFTAEQGGRVDQSNLMSRVLKPAAVEAGLGQWVADPRSRGGRRAESWVGFHTFRHTAATRLIVRDRWSLEEVQIFLGHSDYQTTRRYYVHLLPEDLPERTSIRARGQAIEVDVPRMPSQAIPRGAVA